MNPDEVIEAVTGGEGGWLTLEEAEGLADVVLGDRPVQADANARAVAASILRGN